MRIGLQSDVGFSLSVSQRISLLALSSVRHPCQAAHSLTKGWQTCA